ncbi:SgcJ/EcaC family oxidoreductase [Streptomyces coeruleoprunus]|uniref:SgcJ/EcaC family oxidoreductase n=1 Tax=Streptomyces coeruleoprunus TaxID=285563 RepID=A0ABV9X9Y4_9ACTN
MKVLLIGADGYIGSAVADHLERAGHQVVALVRAARSREGRKREQRTGDLSRPSSLAGAVTPDIDAVIHLATPTGDAAVDAAAVDALTSPLRGTGRAFVYTSGVWVLGATGPVPVTEDASTDPLPVVAYRPRIERQVLECAGDGVRAVVIRPGIVHGRGGGIPALLVDLARKHQGPRYVGDDGVRWPMVHVDDLADLFVLAVERADGGTVWHGVAEPAVPVRDMAAAAGRAAGTDAPARPWAADEAAAALGDDFAGALALDQSVSGDAARKALDWDPRRIGAVADLRHGSYRSFEVFGGVDDVRGEIDAITRLVAEVERTQQSELPEEFMSLFRTEDPVWTTAHGRRLSGWDEISAFTHRVLPGATALSTATYDIERVLFLRPDVAAVNVRQRPVGRDGRPLGDRPEGRPFYILAKEDGVWRIAAAQNTQVIEG